MTLPDPAHLASHYQRFGVSDRILLTGHSHQGWPDIAREAQIRAWDDAAAHVDDKWARAFRMADLTALGYAQRLDDPDGHYALAGSTHDLLIRLLSALPLDRDRGLLTTDAEFHTIRRQLQRLQEAGVPVTVIPAAPAADLPLRLAAAVDDRTACVLVSCVQFQTGRVVRGLRAVAQACHHHGAELLIDAYHAVNVVPYSLRDEGLQTAFVVGGGYKYCQLGEGNAFLRVPPHCTLRPVVTGWFAEFADLADPPLPGQVAYGEGAARFAGATYDPVSHYRGAAVWSFFAEQGLDVPTLHALNQQQVGHLAAGFDALDLDPRVITRDHGLRPADRGGFLVLTSPHAAHLSRELRARGVWTDHRDQALRLGPAPYVTDHQLDQALAHLSELVRVIPTAKEPS